LFQDDDRKHLSKLLSLEMLVAAISSRKYAVGLFDPRRI
jgi:hypothetical protein